MEMTRNHWLIVGMVVLFFGVQLRYVDSFVLNESTTKLVNAQLGAPPQDNSLRLLPALDSTPRRVIRPPEWLGFALMSIGAVTVLYSLVMPKPAG